MGTAAVRLLALLLLWGNPAGADNNFHFNLAHTHHVVDGFGCQLWADQIFAISELKALNIRYIRITQDYTNVTQMKALRDVTDSLGIEWIYVLWGPPQKFRSSRGMLEDIDGFAAYWLDLVVSMHRLGMRPHYLDLMNEPRPHVISVYDYATLVKAVRHKLDVSGNGDVGIVGPGTSSLVEAPSYIDKLDKDALNSLSAFAVHAYDDGIICHGGASCTVPIWKYSFGAAAAAADRQKKIWVTEYASQETNLHGFTYASPDTTGGFSFSRTMAYAARVAQTTIAVLNSGASVAFYWEAEDQLAMVESDRNKSWGFVSRQGKRRPVYDVLKELFARIPRGAKVLAPPTPPPVGNEGIYAGAFATNSLLVVAFANDANTTQNAAVHVGGEHNLKLKEARAAMLAVRGDPLQEQSDISKVVPVELQIMSESPGHSAFNVSLPGDSTLTAVFDLTAINVIV